MNPLIYAYLFNLLNLISLLSINIILDFANKNWYKTDHTIKGIFDHF